MVRIICIYLLILCNINLILSQNLISNPSFSEVNIRKDTSIQHLMLPGKLSNVKDWYLPTYINYKKHHLTSQFTSLYGYTYYFSSRDKDIFLKTKHYTNSDQLFGNNLGFIGFYIDYAYPKTTIQQRLSLPIKKGKYCFRFKYKYIKFKSSANVQLEFSFSNTDLKEYYRQKLKVPLNLIQVSFKDTINDGDENTPWQQQCYIFDLTGKEKYLTIGGLSNKEEGGWGDFFVDDLELYSLVDSSSCPCEFINQNLKELYYKEFPLNEEITNDTLIMLDPHNGFVPSIISPDAKEYLRSIIAFMQRHPDVKIKFIEFREDVNPYLKPTRYHEFKRYLKYFGISKDRISAEIGLCYDPTGVYCGRKSQFMKIGFKLYKD